MIGAGISGLATAWWLERYGLAVRVLEAKPQAGGTIGSARDSGFLVEAGPNSTLDTTPLLGELMTGLGIADERVPADSAARNRYVVRDGRLIALPLTPAAFLSTKLFSWRAKLALAREPFVAAAPADADESVAQFVRRRLGAELLDFAIDPFVSGVYAGDPEKLSLRAAFPRLHALESRYGSLIRGQILGSRERARDAEKAKTSAAMFSFRNGMQTLTDALAARLASLTTNAEAIGIEAHGKRRFTVVAATAAGEARFEASAVVVATPAYAAARLVAPLLPAAAAALEAVPYPPVTVCACAYPRAAVEHPLDGFGVLVPSRERRAVLGSIFSSTLFPGRAPAGSVLLTTFVGGARNPERALQDDEMIVATVQAELSRLVGAPGTAQFVRVTRWPRAIPQYTLGHLQRMAQVERAEQDRPGLFFCANYRGGVAVGDCVKSAAAIAGRIVQALGRQPAA